ncbi:hypothetical protein GCM10010123_35930 [Pilimelia anulata]|uniref:Uncharacterized protein n=1 Tax=Pilimelia anulata TaxID=53371 RepID=A0A8J3FAZ8_9ACTN|nr:hypothetical protein GCM10010123_35930 [Pilimelia anulata]
MMSNVQQPELRRSGHDALVMDSVKGENRDRGVRRGADRHPVPADQRSPYGPAPTRARTDRRAAQRGTPGRCAPPGRGPAGPSARRRHGGTSA